MTMVTLKSVGLCAHYSPVGDRAFRYALALARRDRIQLNIFHFSAEPQARADFELRQYYEDRLGDYLDVGFRVCEGEKTVELRRCLFRGEYQLLVVPYLERGAPFGETTIEDFALRFLSPVVLVGRWRKVRYYLNSQAMLLADRLNLFRGTWRPIPHLNSSCAVG